MNFHTKIRCKEGGILKTVQILMSTYNGEKYLKEQIESLIDQKDVKISILVRDDGSNDGTASILNKFQKNGNLKWYGGKNLGPAKSFLNLMKNAGEFDFYAFCDQDDFWESNKLKEAINQLSNKSSNQPSLYFSKAQLVNKDLKDIEDTQYFLKQYNFGGYLIRNNVTGCTMVFNKKLLHLTNMYAPKNIMMHDHWVTLVCMSLNGNLIYDKKSYIKYRQHEENVIGGKESIIKKIKKSFIFSNNVRQRVVYELYAGYKEYMDATHRKDVEQILNYKKSVSNKIGLLKNKNIKTNSIYDYAYYIAVILGKF